MIRVLVTIWISFEIIVRAILGAIICSELEGISLLQNWKGFDESKMGSELEGLASFSKGFSWVLELRA